MFKIKFLTKRIFRIFPILRINIWCRFVTYLWNDPRMTIHVSAGLNTDQLDVTTAFLQVSCCKQR